MTETLRNTEFVDIEVEFDLASHPIAEQGATITATVDNSAMIGAEVLSALSKNGYPQVRVTSVDNAIGTANLSVKATLTDGVVLQQTLGFNVVAPDADAITLNPGTPQTKTAPAAPAAPAA